MKKNNEEITYYKDVEDLLQKILMSINQLRISYYLILKSRNKNKYYDMSYINLLTDSFEKNESHIVCIIDNDLSIVSEESDDILEIIDDVLNLRNLKYVLSDNNSEYRSLDGDIIHKIYNFLIKYDFSVLLDKIIDYETIFLRYYTKKNHKREIDYYKNSYALIEIENIITNIQSYNNITNNVYLIESYYNIFYEYMLYLNNRDHPWASKEIENSVRNFDLKDKFFSTLTKLKDAIHVFKNYERFSFFEARIHALLECIENCINN